MMPIHSKPLAAQRNPNQEHPSMKTHDLYATGGALMDAEYEVSDTQLQTMAWTNVT